MREIVSTHEGYTFFIEEGKFCDFKTGESRTGKQVADILGISRSSVSQALRASIQKLYKHIRNRNRKLSPMQIALLMTYILEINDESEFKKMFMLFNTKIRMEIKKDASERLQY